MIIKLAKQGPSMWFLGEPDQILANLNFLNPGPIVIDFIKLDQKNQLALIQDLEKGVIESETSIEELKLLVGETVDTSKDGIAALALQKANETIEKMKLLQKQATQYRENKRLQMEKRVDHIVAQPTRSVYYTINHSTDLLFLKQLLHKEVEGQNRKGVLLALQKKVHLLSIEREKKIAKEIRQDMKKQMKETRRQMKDAIYKTNSYDVVEFEGETILLSCEDLIRAAEANK